MQTGRFQPNTITTTLSRPYIVTTIQCVRYFNCFYTPTLALLVGRVGVAYGDEDDEEEEWPEELDDQLDLKWRGSAC